MSDKYLDLYYTSPGSGFLIVHGEVTPVTLYVDTPPTDRDKGGYKKFCRVSCESG